MQKWELSDYQWEQIKDFFPPKTSKCGRARRDPRELLNAIIWVLRTGSPWCALPEKYGSWHTVYNNFRKWSQEGVIEKIFHYFCSNSKEYSQIQIDSTYVKAHHHSAGAKKRGLGQGIGKSRGGYTSKIHAATDENGKAMCILITSGNVYDSTQAENLLHDTIHKKAYVVGDKAFDSEQLLNYIEEKGAISVIPPRKNRKEQRKYDKVIYKNRNQIERFFNRLKQFRRIATRYDKLLLSFLSLVQLAVVFITIPKFSSIV